MRLHPPTAAVRESFGQAQQQAAAMAGGPAAPWQATAAAAPTRRPAWRWRGLTALSLVAGGVAAWLGAEAPNAVPPGLPHDRAAINPLPAATVAQDTLSPAPLAAPSRIAAPAPALALTTTPPPDAAPIVEVTRRAGLIRIVSAHTPLGDVVKALAEATNTRVKGDALLAPIAAAPIALRWQGQDTAAAWNALLGRYANTGLSCNGAGCELWIIGLSATPPVAATAASPPPASMPVSDPVAAPQAVAQPAHPTAASTPPPGNSEENTETN